MILRDGGGFRGVRLGDIFRMDLLIDRRGDRLYNDRRGERLIGDRRNSLFLNGDRDFEYFLNPFWRLGDLEWDTKRFRAIGDELFWMRT